MNRRTVGLLGAVVLIAVSTTASGNLYAAVPSTDSASFTPQGWRITPAGTQIDVGPGPMAMAVSPDGALVVVEDAGYSRHALKVLDAKTGAVVQTVGAADGTTTGTGEGRASYYTGLAWSPDGRWVYASDATRSAVRRFSRSGRFLTEVLPTFSLLGGGTKAPDAYTAGIAVSADSSRLYVIGNLNHTAYVLDSASGRLLQSFGVGHLPYGVALDRAETRAFVTNWGGRTVSVLDLLNGQAVATINVGVHPSAVIANPLRDEIYVANTDSDTISVIDSGSARVVRTINLRPYPDAQVGASPNALSMSPDGRLLFVANAGDNDIAVVRLAGDAAPHDMVLGLIPTAWYPSAVAFDAVGSAIFVANMKGLGVGPAPAGVYWPVLLHGTVSRIAMPSALRLASYTWQVSENDRFGAMRTCANSPIPSTPGGASPIKHVIYVMKENRTYDEVFGDLARGNGDPSLAIFGKSVTPNLHALATQFTTFDNFYADSEVSADGWSWSNGANANTYNQKNWPLDYAPYDRPYDFGGFGNNETVGMPGERPGSSFLWDELAARGISYTNFGFFVDNPVDLQSSMPGLIGHTDPNYPGWDLTTPDQVRMDEWIKVLHSYQGQGSMPTAQFVYLPDDHTWDTTPSARTPQAMLANNDLAVGRLVDAVSHSQFWASTAIFVVEDDAQDGPDHVDGHRTEALVISPYTQTGRVDSTAYSTVSMLRTMELILGVGPMSQFDAVATPMCAAFTRSPSLEAFNARPAQISLFALNGRNAPLAAESAAMDFSRPDTQSEQIANEAVWQSVLGAGAPLPDTGSLAVAP